MRCSWLSRYVPSRPPPSTPGAGFVSRVLTEHQRNAEELGSYQKKIIGIDAHLGVALAGLAPDARVLSNFMRQQSMSSRLLYNRPVPIARVVNAIADKAQVNTQHYGRRPYGVGLLVAGVDETGPHLWEFQPSGMVLEYRGAAIGARSQSARTYLERNFEGFEDASREELVLHGLRALRDSLAQDKELTTANVSLAIVGKNEKFKLYDGDEVADWLEKLGSTQSSRGSRGTAPAAPAAPPAESSGDAAGDSMEVDA